MFLWTLGCPQILLSSPTSLSEDHESIMVIIVLCTSPHPKIHPYPIRPIPCTYSTAVLHPSKMALFWQIKPAQSTWRLSIPRGRWRGRWRPRRGQCCQRRSPRWKGWLGPSCTSCSTGSSSRTFRSEWWGDMCTWQDRDSYKNKFWFTHPFLYFASSAFSVHSCNWNVFQPYSFSNPQHQAHSIRINFRTQCVVFSFLQCMWR